MSVYLTVHFFAVLVYTFPAKTESKLKFYVFPYVYPYFHQSWSMFAPIPKQNFSVYVRYNNYGWQDLFNNINRAHQKNRLAGNEAMLLTFSNALWYYAASAKEVNEVKTDDNANINYVMLKKVIRQYLVISNKQEIKNLEIIIRVKNSTNSLDYSHYYKINN